MLLLAFQVLSPPEGEPFRQPQLAAAGDRVAMAFGSGKALYYAGSEDAGKTFGTPVKVADLPSLALGRHRGPRIALTLDAIVISAVTGENGGGQDGDLVAWHSRDGGKTWSEPAQINDAPASAREGLHAMTSDGRGRIVAAWLDLRQKGTRLYGSESRDRGRTWSPNKLIYESPDGSICECCHPSVTVAPDGSVSYFFRNHLEGARDMYIVENGKATRAGKESWMLEACPMDGGDITTDSIGNPVAVWRRKNEIYLSLKPGEEVLLGEGKDPAVAISGGITYAGWTSPKGLMMWRSDTSAVVSLDTSGAFLQLARVAGGQVLAAWETGRGIKTKLLGLSGPTGARSLDLIEGQKPDRRFAVEVAEDHFFASARNGQ